MQIMLNVLGTSARWLCALAIGMAFATVGLAEERIVLSADPNCGSCNLDIAPGETGTFYVLASSSDFIGLVGGALFRIVGIPETWGVQATPNPESNLQIGDPVGNGVGISFPTQQSGQCTLLYTIELQATSEVQDLMLTVEAFTPPPNPNFDCPRMTYICGACDIFACATGTTLTINSTVDCFVAVSESTWGSVKSLYAP